MKFDIVTLFPNIYDSYFNTSILRRAVENKKIKIKAHNIRDFAKDKHKTADDTPYGGGAGMVLKAEPILSAVKKIVGTKPQYHSAKNRSYGAKKKKTKVIILSAKGKQFSQKIAKDWAKKYDQLVMISGRYEGIDERVKTILRAEEISIGPYVLTDGDVAAMTIVSSVARLVPGVINLRSLAEESHFDALIKDEGKKGLEYPHYTKPEVFIWKGKKYRVPKVLLTGNHKKIAEWREEKSK